MIKKTATAREAGTVSVYDGEVASIAAFISGVKDSGRAVIASNIASEERRERENREREERYAESAREAAERAERYRAELAALPPVVVPSVEDVRAELAKVAALPFVKAVDVVEHEGGRWLHIKTRAEALKSTCNKKYNADLERWYTVRPYSFTLPAYDILLSTTPMSTVANNSEGLLIKLADEHDTSAFRGRPYSQEVHPHWATGSTRENSYMTVCLGEYEGEIMAELRASLSRGLIAFAIFLQNAGDRQAYIKKERWMLWIGKPEYNALIIKKPSAKQEAEEVESEPEDDYCDCREHEDDDCDDPSECSCDCHTND